MDSKDLRKKFIEFFEKNGHKQIPGSSLVPENDASVLFTTAGMQPLVPYLMGENHPAGDKLVNIQPCIRTDDINEVGDDSHLTFFEMMGYWSLNAYWKKEAINLSYDFFTKELNIDPKNLAITCFEGDEKNGIPKDTESAEVWLGLGIPEKRIKFLGYKDNFWGPTSPEGPCGPDTEIFVWTGDGEAPEIYDPKDKNWVEIGNDVFMRYKKFGEKYQELSQKNVDFGSGFERVAAYIENKNNVYETDLFEPIIKKIEEISGKKYEDNKNEFRIITDHIKAATFAINDGIMPSNKDRGYIVRRLIRRSIIKAAQLDIRSGFVTDIARVVADIYASVYTINENVINDLKDEEEKFRTTLENGMREFEAISGLKAKSNQENWKPVEMNADDLFKLYQSFGFPLELSIELAEQYNIPIKNGAEGQFMALFRTHQDLSRTASAGMFKGGLASGGEQETKYHTTTHLLQAALRKVLGPDVYQRGSNINAERLRFDFSYPDKMTLEKINEVEDIVNSNIEKDLEVTTQEMTLDEAKKLGAIGIFENKYGDKVKVYIVGSGDNIASKEICGGPHVKRTSELGHFKITKEESSSSGIRRIKAILE